MFIEYIFTQDDGKVLQYKIDFDRTRKHTLDEKHYCTNCPLKIEEYSHCPVAIDAHEIVLGFKEILSCKEVDIHVITPERDRFKSLDWICDG